MGLFTPKNTGVKGFDKVLYNLNKELKKIENATEEGLVKAFAYIRYETEHTTPKTPVDFGNLRASWFVVTATKIAKTDGKFVNNTTHGISAESMATRHSMVIQSAKAEARKKMSSKKCITVIGGYSANYAMYVHENLNVGQGKPSKRASGKYISGWNRLGSAAKWFQTHFVLAQRNIISIVAINVKSK